MNEQETQSSIHIPVLLNEIIEHLDLSEGDVVFDGTLGGGGYTRAIAHQVGPTGHVIATDQDQDAIDRFNTKLVPQVVVHHSPFALVGQWVEPHSLDGAVLDLGISSDQLHDRERGISFQDLDAPLDMRMNQSLDNHLTAWGILHTWEEEEIANMIYRYGDERYSRRIARAIVTLRSTGEMETVGDLIHAVTGGREIQGKIHPATKTFQALRIAVNNELGQLEQFLQVVPQYMKPGGRLVIVSFHSAEDRIVKQTFKQWRMDNLGTVITKKPVAPTREEISQNPRSRSSKLRTFEFT